jgi:hypothetical protein
MLRVFCQDSVCEHVQDKSITSALCYDECRANTANTVVAIFVSIKAGVQLLAIPVFWTVRKSFAVISRDPFPSRLQARLDAALLHSELGLAKPRRVASLTARSEYSPNNQNPPDASHRFILPAAILQLKLYVEITAIQMSTSVRERLPADSEVLQSRAWPNFSTADLRSCTP